MAVSVSLSRFAGDLRMANRATGTIQLYVASIRRFEEFLGQELADASQESIRRWVDHLRSQAIGASRLGQHYSALKFVYARTLGQPEKVAWITIPKAKAHLPSILGRPEIQRLLDGFTTAKSRMFFTLIYATGLRITEASLLETQDIDSMQKVIHVRHGKGDKHRMVPMDGKLYLIAQKRSHTNQTVRAQAWGSRIPSRPNCLLPQIE
jgi:site-specific recombinase XerD